jgi:hypothetical protein
MCVCLNVYTSYNMDNLICHCLDVSQTRRQTRRRIPRRRRPASPPPKSTGTAPFLPTWVTQSPETDRRREEENELIGLNGQLPYVMDGSSATELFIYSRVDCETLFFAKITRAGISLIGEACQVFISSHRPSSHRSIPLALKRRQENCAHLSHVPTWMTIITSRQILMNNHLKVPIHV